MDVLDDLSWRITPCWKSVGRKLKVDEYVLEGIIENNIQYPAPQEKAVEMLKAWKNRGKASTISELSAALRKVGMGGLAEQLDNNDLAGAREK